MLYFSVNIHSGSPEERILLTGRHAVSDIFCKCCGTTLGWKYVSIYFFKLNFKNYFCRCFIMLLFLKHFAIFIYILGFKNISSSL